MFGLVDDEVPSTAAHVVILACSYWRGYVLIDAQVQADTEADRR